MFTRAVLASFVVSAFVGCGGGSSGPTLYSVTGKVTKGGAPLGGVTVSLVATDEKTEAPALKAVTKDDGSFDVYTLTGKRGAPVGVYKVVVVPPPEEIDYATQRGAPKKSKVVPATYQSPASTELSIEVQKTSNTLDIKIP